MRMQIQTLLTVSALGAAAVVDNGHGDGHALQSERALS